MKEQLLALVGKSVDIIIVQNCFLDEKNYFRACMFGKLYRNEDHLFKVIPADVPDSANSIEFTVDMVRNLNAGPNHSSIQIRIPA